MPTPRRSRQKPYRVTFQAYKEVVEIDQVNWQAFKENILKYTKEFVIKDGIVVVNTHEQTGIPIIEGQTESPPSPPYYIEHSP